MMLWLQKEAKIKLQHIREDYKEIFEFVKDKAEKGNAQRQYELASIYKQGIIADSDSAKALEWYEKAANQGYALAQAHLGIIFLEKKEYSKSKKWLKRAAEQDHLQSQFILNLLNTEPPEIFSNIIKAIIKAIHREEKYSQINLSKEEKYEVEIIKDNTQRKDILAPFKGSPPYEDERFSRNKEKENIIDYNIKDEDINDYRFALAMTQDQEGQYDIANHNYQLAFKNLEIPYEIRKEKNSSELKQYQLPKIAVDKGNAEAQFALGDYYYLGCQFVSNSQDLKNYYVYNFETKQRNYYGLGNIPESSKNYLKAVKWYSLAASQGHLGALWSLAECYELGRGVPESFDIAFKLYYEAANKNHPPAMQKLATMYSSGLDIPKDSTKALYWFKRAAEEDYAPSQYQIAVRYYRGDEVEQDEKKALSWLHKSAIQDYPPAQFLLGEISDNESEAVKWYEKSAEQGYPRAQYNLAIRHAYGQGVLQDPQQAFKWYQRAAEQGYREAQCNLGNIYLEGEIVQQNIPLGISWMQKAAEQKDSQAQYNLGILYMLGRNVIRNDELAFYWFKEAAKQDFIEAEVNLATMYFYGKGTKQNTLKAIKWLQKAADAGCEEAKINLGVIKEDYKELIAFRHKKAKEGKAESQYQLANFYLEGKIIDKNYSKATKWMLRAAEQNHVQAQAKIGAFYLGVGLKETKAEEIGVKKDIQEAKRWLLKAANKDEPHAQYNLSLLYLEKEKNIFESIKWLKRAAHNGEIHAQSNFAIHFERGIGIKKDLSEAFKWYQKAAEQGYPEAQYNLAKVYLKGEAVTQNKEKAFEWMEKAAKQGLALAQSDLGAFYSKGIGTSQNMQQAFKWTKKSAEQGGSAAYYNLGILYTIFEPVIDYNKARECYFKAIDHGDITSYRQIGIMYKEGQSVEKNYVEALKYFYKAAEGKDIEALSYIAQMYLLGLGVDKDPKEALNWYEKAAEQNDVIAQYNVGYLYSGKHGINLDKKMSLYWYEKAAEQGDKEAQFKLAKYYKKSQEPIESLKWYRKAAEQGNTQAQFDLYKIYNYSNDIVRDELESDKWLGRALRINKNLSNSLSKDEQIKHFKLLALSTEGEEPLFQIPPTEAWRFFSNRITSLKEIEDKYDIFLFDIVGVVHNGQDPFEYCVKAINQLSKKKKVIFLSNAPRPNPIPKEELKKHGIQVKDVSFYTAGDAVRDDLQNNELFKDKMIYHFGADTNEHILAGLNVQTTTKLDDAEIVLLTKFVGLKKGFKEQEYEQAIHQFDQELKLITQKGIPILCANSDKRADKGDNINICAGTFAEMIENFGKGVLNWQGKVYHYGKPNSQIYESALKSLNKSYNKKRIVMLGDTLENDIMGANKYEIDSVLILTGNTAKLIKKDPKKDLPSFIRESSIKPTYYMDYVNDEDYS